MTESAFFASVISGMMFCFFAGYQWGQYVKIFKNLGRAV